jgi:DNA-binding transcriptional LysR family regulator
VPLLLYPPPSITRGLILAALERAGRPWRVACISGSLTGLRAAALAGLGILGLARRLIPAGLAELPRLDGLPELDEVEFILLGAGRALRPPAARLCDAILAHADALARQ